MAALPKNLVPTSSTTATHFCFFLYLPMSSSALPPPSLLSLLLLLSSSSIKRTWLKTGVAAREFVREWKVFESSLFACFGLTTLADRGGRRPHEHWWDPHLPRPTRSSLHALLRVLDLLPQINKELVSFGDREWCYVRWYVPSLSFLPSCSPLLLSPSICCCCLFKFTGLLQMYYNYLEHIYLHSLHLWCQWLLPGRPQAPNTLLM